MIMKVVRYKGVEEGTEKNIYLSEFPMGNDEAVIDCLNLIQEKLDEGSLISVTEEDIKN